MAHGRLSSCTSMAVAGVLAARTRTTMSVVRSVREHRGIVMSVEYKLAPAHKFPGAVHDAIDASRWASNNADELGADPARIVLAGDSAGANLAAVAALTARDEGAPDICCQLLIYPATDLSMSCRSHQLFGDGYRLTRPLMVWSATNYLRSGVDIMDPRASPLICPEPFQATACNHYNGGLSIRCATKERRTRRNFERLASTLTIVVSIV